jgi:hypothetical protein
MLIGDNKELVLVARKPRGRIFHVVCFGRRAHYRKDGTCKHTDEVMAKLKPGISARVDGWGGKPDGGTDGR